MYLVSACLAGEYCRYDGKTKGLEWVKKLVEDGLAVTACPEQLGGLSTPRLPADLMDCSGEDVLLGQGKVIDSSGRDVSEKFILGAKRALAIAKEHNCTKAILKARSPSCGFCPTKKGVAAALLLEHGLQIKNEEDF